MSNQTEALVSLDDLVGDRKFWHWPRDPFAPYPRPALCGETCTRQLRPGTGSWIGCPDCIRLKGHGWSENE